MKTFFKLTAMDGKPIYVNLDRAEWVRRYDEETHITFQTNEIERSDGTIVVQEAPEAFIPLNN